MYTVRRRKPYLQWLTYILKWHKSNCIKIGGETISITDFNENRILRLYMKALIF